MAGPSGAEPARVGSGRPAHDRLEAAARLRWGADWIAAPRASRAGPLLPLLAAAVLSAVFLYVGYWWLPHGEQDSIPSYPVQRSIGAALMAGVGYVGMILFPRLTASMAGAVAGPTLFAVVGYTLFPSFMAAASDLNTITEAEERLADLLTYVFAWCALAVATAAILTMILSRRQPQRPLSYALWVGALTLCMAVSGTFNGAYPGR